MKIEIHPLQYMEMLQRRVLPDGITKLRDTGIDVIISTDMTSANMSVDMAHDRSKIIITCKNLDEFEALWLRREASQVVGGTKA